MESDVISDGILSQDESQLQSIWSFRELIPESVGKHGPTYKYDLSVPLPVMYSIVEETRARFIEHGLLAPDGSEGDLLRGVVGYGHIGDGMLISLLTPIMMVILILFDI
jgi:D-lactate dehydrogenase (cytochrome)